MGGASSKTGNLGDNSEYDNSEAPLSEEEEEEPTTEAAEKPRRHDAKKMPTKTLDDYVLLETLGKGSFGRVRLARDDDSGKLFAIKMLKKRQVISNGAVDHLLRERRVLMEVRHPFIVHLQTTFQDMGFAYFVLQFIQGGPFDTRLKAQGSLADHDAAFYTAQIVLILEHLHGLGYMYRDLKPANLIFDMSGYVILTDFGFAKLCETATTLCGTPEYLAPEILKQRGYDHAVDWWAAGIVLCEMLTGTTPFVADDDAGTYDRILGNSPKWPNDLEGSGKALVKKFLAVNPQDRIGRSGVRSHKFFKSIDWKKLAKRKLQAPHEPFINFSEDTSNFEEYPDTPGDPSETPNSKSRRSSTQAVNFDGGDPFAAFDDL